MMDDDKYTKLYQEILIESKRDDMLQKGLNSVNDKGKDLLNKLDDYFREKCTNQFKWFDQNAIIGEKDYKPKNNKVAEEFPARLKDLDQCVQDNDPKGYTKQLINFEDEYVKFRGELTTNLKKCRFIEDEKDMRTCMKNAIVSKVNLFMNVVAEYEKKYDEINKQI
jgi:hypothetical protein